MSEDITVQNLAALSLVHVAPLDEGTVAYVDSEAGFFFLQKASLFTPDGVLVIAPAPGSPIAGAATAAWVSQSILPSVVTNAYAAQATWFISEASGSDSNDGLTALTALKTHEELMRRVGHLNITAPTVTVTVLDAPILAPVGTWQLGENGFVQYRGVVTVIYTSTFTAATTFSPFANTPQDVTDSAIPISWTASGFVEQRGRRTVDSELFWVGKDLGAKTARITPFPGVAPPAPGEEYVIETLTTLPGLALYVQGGPNSALDLIDLKVSNLCILRGTNINAIGCSIESYVEGFGEVNFSRCLLNFTVCDTGSSTQIETCLLVGAFNAFTASNVRIVNANLSQVGMVISGQVTVLNTGVGIFDSSAQGLSVLPGGVVQADGLIWGTDNNTVGIDVRSGGLVVYTPKPIVTGLVDDTNIAGVDTPYAGIPTYDTAHACGIVVDA